MTTTAAAWFAVAFFLLPGWIINWVAGMRAPAAAAAALPVTFGVIGLGAWGWGLTTAPFNLWTYGVSVVIAVLVAAVWRAAFVRKARRWKTVTWRRALFPGKWRERSLLDPYWILPGAGIAVGAFMLISDRLAWLVRLPHGVNNIFQGWDVQWHANTVRFIMDTGIASSTRMGELQNVETHADLLYPAAFHAGIALFGEAAGLDPVPALNIGQIVLSGLALPITMACLVFAFLRSRGVTAQIGAGLAAIAIYAAPQVAWIGDYVGMWPYLFAMSMTGIVIWQFISVPGARASALSAALGFVGVLTAHPSAVTVIVIAVVLFWLTSTLVRPERSRVMDTVWMALPAVGGALTFLPIALAGSEQAEEVSGWQAFEDASNTDGWETAFSMETRHILEFFPDFDATIALWLAGFGALVALFWRGQIWPALFYLISLTATVNAIDPFDTWYGDALASIGNLHYNTAHRLILPVAMCVVAGAAIAVAAMIRLITLAPIAARRDSPAWARATTAASAAAAVAVAAFAVPAVRETTFDGAKNAFTSARNSERMVSNDDLAAFNWLASQPAAFDGYTMGVPSDGHSWIYAIEGVPTLARHFQWPTGGRGSDFDILYWQPDFIGEGLRGDPTAETIADKAIEELNVKFFISSPGLFWWYQLPRFEIIRGFWVSKGVTPVYRKGDVVIFAVNSQFTDMELKDMRRDALEHGSEELAELSPSGLPAPPDPTGPTGPAGPAENDSAGSGTATWNTMGVLN